jgi:lactate dehydrogenase-like 2-hydroxyacid dehydrogenase
LKNKIKKGLNKLASFKKSYWKNNGGKKILISVNQYFSKESWKKLISNNYSKETENWDIVYSSGKLDISKHFADADICFLFGYSYLNEAADPKPKLLYFPLIGLDFLEGKKIPANYQIEKPPVYSKTAIAEYCFSMSILIKRGLQFAFKNQYENKWEQKEILSNDFRSISSEKIGILGVGNIGHAIAECFKNNGCEVMGCDVISNPSFSNIDKWFNVTELHDFLKVIDILIIALPPSSAIGNKSYDEIISENISVGKKEGIKQFVFTSSTGVYSDETGVYKEDGILSNSGRSQNLLAAENALVKNCNNYSFCICSTFYLWSL